VSSDETFLEERKKTKEGNYQNEKQINIHRFEL